MPKVGLQFGHFSTYVAFGKYQLVVVVLLPRLKTAARKCLLRLGLCGGGRKQRAQKRALDFVLGLIGDVAGVELYQFLKPGLYFANIQILLHLL